MPPFLIAIIAILIITIIAIFLTYNNLVKLKMKVEEAFSTMDVYLKKRWDLIPNLVSTVKGYAKHERVTLEEIILLRNSTYDKMSQEEKIKSSTDIKSAIDKVMLLAESYPDLKANENFLKLAEELSEVEDEIANARKYYNATIRLYNNKVEMFPSSILANILGYKKKKMFEIEKGERENVTIDLKKGI